MHSALTIQAAVKRLKILVLNVDFRKSDYAKLYLNFNTSNPDPDEIHVSPLKAFKENFT